MPGYACHSCGCQIKPLNERACVCVCFTSRRECRGVELFAQTRSHLAVIKAVFKVFVLSSRINLRGSTVAVKSARHVRHRRGRKWWHIYLILGPESRSAALRTVLHSDSDQ